MASRDTFSRYIEFGQLMVRVNELLDAEDDIRFTPSPPFFISFAFDSTTLQFVDLNSNFF